MSSKDKSRKTPSAARPSGSHPLGGKQNVGWGLSPVYLLSGILVLVASLYSNSLHNGILNFDDNEYFQNYPEILNLSWSSIKKYFTSYYVIMYQPIPVLTFALNYHFSGFNTFPMHVVNLLFHLGNIILVYKFIESLTGKTQIAIIVALLFGIHPMNVEAVSWISARSSGMYTFFYLFGLIYYIRYLKENHFKNLLITGVFFITALFTKSQAVTFPVVMLLLDYYYDRRLLSKNVILEKIPFLVLSVVFGLITLSNDSTMHNINQGMLIAYTPIDIFFIVTYSFVFYLVKLILPFSLCAIYVYPPKDGGFLPWEYYASAAVFLGLAYAIFKVRSNKKIILCVGLFLITIAINIQIIPSRLFIVTDRYAYFPYIGLFLLPLLLIDETKQKNLFKFNKYATTLTVILVVYVFVFSISVFQRNKVWQNDIVFLSDVISKNPPVGYIYRAYGNRGFAYKQNGQLNEALADFNEANKLDSTDGRNYYNRALIYAAMNNNAAALIDFNKADKINPNQPLLYSYRAQIKFLLNDTLGSIDDCRKCLSLDSSNVDCYNTLANIDYARKDFINCEKNLSLAIKFKPDFSVAIKNRGLLYIQMNRKDDACSDFMNASNLNNPDAKALFRQYCAK